MRLLNVVMSNLANLSEPNDSVLQVITTLRILVFEESFLFRDKHFVHTFIKWWTEGIFFRRRSNKKIQPSFFLVRNFKTIDQLFLLSKSIFGLDPHSYSVFVDFSVFGLFNTQ